MAAPTGARAARLATPGPFRVASWHLAQYRRMWRINLLSTFVQPLLYLLGLGVGVGTLVDRNTGSTDTLGGIPYVAFVAPGLLVTTAMALGAVESMWPVLGGLKWSRGYHAVAATPLDARDIVLGHATWIAFRTVTAAAAVAVVLAFFDDTRAWGLVPSVVVAALVGLAFAMPIMAFSVTSEYDGGFAGLQRFVIIPLFLFGGAFYPLSQLPDPLAWVARAAPIWHGVVVARGLTVGGDAHGIGWGAALGHLAYVALWAAAGGWLATRRLRRRLYP